MENWKRPPGFSSSIPNKDLYLLLEGDLSDLSGIESSEDEEEVSLTLNTDFTSLERNNVEFEVSDEEEDVPLATIQKQGQPNIQEPVIVPSSSSTTANPLWRKVDFDPGNTTFISPDKTIPEEVSSPYAYFKRIVTQEVMEMLAYETNLYSFQKSEASISTNAAEIEQFLGIHLFSGVSPVPSYRMYWSERLRVSAVADIMSRNRFDTLRRYFHINDNTKMVPREDPTYDKLFKVRPFLTLLRTSFLKIEADEIQSIDEILIPFKGHSSLKQYIKNKPHKWGIKIFARCSISGILHDFIFYVGKGTLPDSANFIGISGDVVLELTKELPKNCNYKITCDNWFSSYRLAVELKRNGFQMTGTVRANRLPKIKFVDDKDLKKQGRGSHDCWVDTNENILAIKWFDNKSVHLISTERGVNPMAHVKRWSTTAKKYMEVECPDVVSHYNSTMGGVDLLDMLVALYRVKIKSPRFYLRIVFHMLDIAVVNAWLVYRRDWAQINKNNKYLNLLNFKTEIALACMQANKGSTGKKRGRPLTSSPSPSATTPKMKPRAARPIFDVRYDGMNHWPEHIPDKTRCKLCIKRHSRWSCSKCKVALCLNENNNCFVQFHKL